MNTQTSTASKTTGAPVIQSVVDFIVQDQIESSWFCSVLRRFWVDLLVFSFELHQLEDNTWKELVKQTPEERYQLLSVQLLSLNLPNFPEKLTAPILAKYNATLDNAKTLTDKKAIKKMARNALFTAVLEYFDLRMIGEWWLNGELAAMQGKSTIKPDSALARKLHQKVQILYGHYKSLYNPGVLKLFDAQFTAHVKNFIDAIAHEIDTVYPGIAPELRNKMIHVVVGVKLHAIEHPKIGPESLIAAPNWLSVRTELDNLNNRFNEVRTKKPDLTLIDFIQTYGTTTPEQLKGSVAPASGDANVLSVIQAKPAVPFFHSTQLKEEIMTALYLSFPELTGEVHQGALQYVIQVAEFHLNKLVGPLDRLLGIQHLACTFSPAPYWTLADVIKRYMA